MLNEMAEDPEESTESLEFSQRDIEIMMEAVENPPAPNEKLKQAAVKYKQLQQDDFSDLDVTLQDGLDELEENIYESFDQLAELEEELDNLEDQIYEIETEEELDELEDQIEELEDEIEELEEEIEEDIETLTKEIKPGLSTQLSQPETRIVDDKRKLKKGPLWEYRTNYEDDDKFD